MEIKLSDSETDLLQLILNQLVIKSRTGEIGIMHGFDRFVSTHIPLKKEWVKVLDQLAAKAGARINRYSG